MKFPCICGGSGIHQVGTVTRTVNDVEIKVNKVPHYYCDACGEIWYDITEVLPSKYIKYAYDNGLSEIEYKGE